MGSSFPPGPPRLAPREPERRILALAGVRVDEYLTDVVASIIDSLVVTDERGTILIVNRATLYLLGYEADELLGTFVGRLIAEDPEGSPGPDVPPDFVAHTLARGEDQEYIAKDGARIPVLFSPTLMLARRGAMLGLVLVASDARRRRALEAELRQAQRLEALGRLSAGVAHEINTPMQFVSDNVRFLEGACEELDGRVRRALGPGAELPRELAETLAEIPQAVADALVGVERVTRIVRAMKQLSHAGTSERALSDLNQAVLDAVVLTRHELMPVADVALELGDLPPVLCHAGEIGQVFLNLLVNTAQAIADAKRGSRGQVRIRSSFGGDGVVFTFADDGGGIPPAIQDRVFEPFFTTKAVGRGSGQGLALVRSIVQRHGGSVGFETEPGEGTTFTVRLPVRP